MKNIKYVIVIAIAIALSVFAVSAYAPTNAAAITVVVAQLAFAIMANMKANDLFEENSSFSNIYTDRSKEWFKMLLKAATDRLVELVQERKLMCWLTFLILVALNGFAGSVLPGWIIVVTLAVFLRNTAKWFAYESANSVYAEFAETEVLLDWLAPIKERVDWVAMATTIEGGAAWVRKMPKSAQVLWSKLHVDFHHIAERNPEYFQKAVTAITEAVSSVAAEELKVRASIAEKAINDALEATDDETRRHLLVAAKMADEGVHWIEVQLYLEKNCPLAEK